MKLAPQTATRAARTARKWKSPSSQVRTGDVFVGAAGREHPGGRRGAGGQQCAVNEAALTGESIPVDKAAGDARFGRNGQSVRLSDLPRRRAWARTRPFRRSSRWSATQRPPRRPLQRLRTRCPGVFVPAVHRRSRGSDRSSGCCWARASATRWRAVSRCWSSAVPARWGWPRRWRSWSAAALGAKNGILFKNAPRRWKKPAASRSWRSTRPARSPTGEPQVTDMSAPRRERRKRNCCACAFALETAQRASRLPGPSCSGAQARTWQAEEVADFRAAAGQRACRRRWTGGRSRGGNLRFHQRAGADRTGALEAQADALRRDRAKRRCSSAADGRLARHHRRRGRHQAETARRRCASCKSMGIARGAC